MAKNTTLSPTAPSQHFSAGTVTTRPPLCTTEADCSLAGVCTTGVCVCDGWSHGNRCEELNLLPVDSTQPGYRNTSGYNTWGGASIAGDDGRFYLFLSQMGGKCTLLGHWAQVSEGVRLVSDTPNGPFSEAEVVIPSFAHNIKPFRAPDGTWLLFYIGEINNITANCSAPTHLRGEGGADPPGKTTAGPVMLASAARPDAPAKEWTRHGPLTDSVSWHSATNPSAVFFANGTVILAVSRSWEDPWNGTHFAGGGKRTTLMRADSWRGPYTNITHGFVESIPNGEDPDLFRTERGVFMLNHNTGPGSTKIWFSKDGVTNWRTNAVGANAFDENVVYSNETTIAVCQRQRPQIVMAKDGMPGWLWTGVMTGLPNGECPTNERDPRRFPTWTLAQKIGRHQHL